MQPFKRFFVTSLLLISIPLPLLSIVGFKTGGILDVLPNLAFVGALSLLYWWPLGWFFSRQMNGRRWARILAGYLLSIPLYYATLAVLYPVFGGKFRPFSNARWMKDSGATVMFYTLVVTLFSLTRWRHGKWIARGALVMLGVSALPPFLFMAGPKWPKQGSDHVVVKGARIVDVASSTIVDGQDVFIQGGRIVAIGPPSLHPDWPQIDAGGQFLLPGLIDVHTHLQVPFEVPQGFKPGYFLKSIMSDCAPQRRAYLAAGVTSVRDLGGPATKSFRMRRELSAKKMLGPRLYTVGRLVTSPHGHPVTTIWTPSISRQGAILAGDEASLIAGLERNFAEGPPDAVKFVHGTIGRAEEELSADLMARGIRWSAERALISVVHAETPTEVEAAILAGATGVEHSAWLQEVPESLRALVARTRPFMDPTFGGRESSLGLAKHPADVNANRMARSYAAVRELWRSGAIIAVGSDAPLVRYGIGFQEELAHFLEAGFQPSEILRFATLNNAAYLGRAEELGRIAPGYRADLILTRENPLAKLETLRRPVWTMLNGQIVSRESDAR